MDANFGKVLGDRNRIVVDLKRKRGKNGKNAIASGMMSPLRCSSAHELGKRRKVEGGYTSLFSKSLRNCYSNFMKSGIPKRLMYYQHGVWVDFPEDTLGLVQKTFQAKIGMVEVEFNGEWFCLDFLHMIQLDMKTGLQHPVAWIDEADHCYFPETFSNAEFPNYVEGNGDYQPLECQGLDGIKLLLEIEINGSEISGPKEFSGEYNPVTYDAKLDDSHVKVAGVAVDEDRVGTEPIRKNVSTTSELGKGHLDTDTIREIFYKGIHLRDSANIIAICRGSSNNSMEARYELFLKQIEITRRYRGDSNVQYAWLPSSKKITSAIMKYGLGSSLPSKIMPTHGYGVYLIPAKCTETSAKLCDIDEKGVRHMILCRVILGNVELVSPGSKLFHPSSEEFDSGIDDLQNPKHYIVWNMNASTHIYPEYVVSFQLSSDAKVFSSGTANLNLPMAGACLEVPEVPVRLGSPSSCLTSEYRQAPSKISQERVANVAQGSVRRAPRSPWISLPDLFAAISNEIPEKVMNDVKSTYESYKSEKISRDDFVKNLRLLVGDPLLRAMLTKYQRKVPSKAEIEQMEQKPRPEA